MKNVLLFLKITKDLKKIHIPINAYKGRKLCPDYTQYLYVINQETPINSITNYKLINKWLNKPSNL
jgi:hypothetical protein